VTEWLTIAHTLVDTYAMAAEEALEEERFFLGHVDLVNLICVKSAMRNLKYQKLLKQLARVTILINMCLRLLQKKKEKQRTERLRVATSIVLFARLRVLTSHTHALNVTCIYVLHALQKQRLLEELAIHT
jgi:hypothetical protein